jgi:hypothetical protein
MTKNNTKASVFGPHHADSLKRANTVPAAQKGFPNTNPGYDGPPLLHKPVSSIPKEKGKK